MSVNRPKPKGRTGHYQMVYIADGFAEDCEMFIQCCLDKDEKLTYQKFSTVWREMNFSSIYNGRTFAVEIAELSEEVIRIAKRYMIADTSNFEENVAGLFLVYALLNLQPYSEFASLRLVPSDMNAINRIESSARKDRRLDVLYILGHVLVTGPVQYQADERERGMEVALRKYYEEGFMSIDRQGLRPKGVFHMQDPILDTLKNMKASFRQYEAAKKKIKTPSGVEDQNLKYCNVNLAAELEESLKHLICGIPPEEAAEKKAAVGGTKTQPDHHEKVQALKAKAMANTARPINHRTGVQERRNMASTCVPHKLDIRSTPGKVKSGSPRKPLATNSPRKPIQAKTENQKPNQNTRKKRTSISSSDSDSDSDMSLKFDDSESEWDVDDEATDSTMDDFLHKMRAKEKLTNQDGATTSNIQEVNIRLDTCPVYIREDGGNLEIEVITQNNDSNDSSTGTNTKRKRNKKASAQILSLPDISFENADTGPVVKNDTNDSPSSAQISETKEKRRDQDDSVFKKPIVLNNLFRLKTDFENASKSDTTKSSESVEQPSTSKPKDKTPEKINDSSDESPNKKKRGRPHKSSKSPKDTKKNKNVTNTAERVTRSRSNSLLDKKDKPNDDNLYIISDNNGDDLQISSLTIGSREETNGSDDDDDESIINIPQEYLPNRRPLTPNLVNVKDAEMVVKYVTIHGRSKKVDWNSQSDEFAKHLRGHVPVTKKASAKTLQSAVNSAKKNLNLQVLKAPDTMTTTFTKVRKIGKKEKSPVKDKNRHTVTANSKNSPKRSNDTRLEIPAKHQKVSESAQIRNTNSSSTSRDLGTINFENINLSRLSVNFGRMSTSVCSDSEDTPQPIVNSLKKVENEAAGSSAEKRMVPVTELMLTSLQKPPMLRKLEKRDLKQPIRKNRFKKMGITEIANIDKDKATKDDAC